MSFIVLIHNSTLGNELIAPTESNDVFSSKEEGIIVNIKFLIFKGKFGIRVDAIRPKVVKNDISENFNFLIGIIKINDIKTANIAFLEVDKIII